MCTAAVAQNARCVGLGRRGHAVVLTLSWLLLRSPLPAAAQAQPAAPAAATPAPAAAGTPAAAAPANARPAAAAAAPGRPQPTAAAPARPASNAASRVRPVDEAEPEDPEPPSLALAAKLGIGYMRGGRQGGLMTARPAPMALDVDALVLREQGYLIGGGLRLELTGPHGVAAIFRFALRHMLGPLELRPGVSVPFYIAPRSMLGVEASLTMKYGLSDDLGILLDLTGAAFVIGDDVPKGSTVIMLHALVGVELFL